MVERRFAGRRLKDRDSISRIHPPGLAAGVIVLLALTRGSFSWAGPEFPVKEQPVLEGSAKTDVDSLLVRKLLRQAQKLVDDPASDELVQAIAVAQVKAGDTTGAVQTIQSLTESSQVDVGFRMLTEALAEAGKLTRAEQIVAMIRDTADGYCTQTHLAWLAIGHGHAKAGNRKAAALAFSRAVQATVSKEKDWLAADRLCEVATAQAGMADRKAARATFRRATECARAEKDPDFSQIALNSIAEAQARSGDFAQAFKTVDRLKDQSATWSNIAVIQAEMGAFKAAQQTTGRIEHRGTRGRAWLRIAEAQRRKGHCAGATESLKRAVQAWNEMEGPSRKASALQDGYRLEADMAFLQDVASFQAALGEKTAAEETFNEARRILDKAVKVGSREYDYRTLGVALGKAGFRKTSMGCFKKALALAGALDLGIKDRDLQETFQTAAVAVIAKAQAEAGFFPEALQTAKLIKDDFQRELTTSQVGEEQANHGDIQGAWRTAKELSSKGRQDWIRYAIAVAQLDKGDWKTALKTALAMEDSYWKGIVLRQIGERQARTDFQGALNWCNKQRSPEVRARALLGIAEGILARHREKPTP
jgi:tetratricopeptide (TPR) repeat protein